MFPFVLFLFISGIGGGIAYAVSQKDRPREYVTGELDEPIDEPDEPEPKGAVIPYGPGEVWELFVLEDGRFIDGEGDEYETIVPLGVCPGDTIIIRVPPQAFEEDAEPFLSIDVGWLDLVTDDWAEGVFAWRVYDVEGEDTITQTGVDVFDNKEQETTRYGFNVSWFSSAECAAA